MLFSLTAVKDPVRVKRKNSGQRTCQGKKVNRCITILCPIFRPFEFWWNDLAQKNKIFGSKKHFFAKKLLLL